MADFTREQLKMFAHLATEKANRQAALCYPANDPRIERAAQELMVFYYRQYTTPPCGCRCGCHERDGDG